MGEIMMLSNSASNIASDSSVEMSGYAVHDMRGNAFWQLSTASEAHDLESTTVVLRKLAIPELALSDASAAKKSPHGYDAHGGYSPYNRTGRHA
jgi:hypothetical protein